MIQRAAKESLTRLAAQFPVVGVTGPRQSGKSTLVQEVFPEKRYVTLDDDCIRALAESNPKDFVDAFPDGVIIDEAHKVPEIFNALKLKVDSEKSEAGKYILTGSSQFKPKKNMTDSLAGRAFFLELLPFSMNELKGECPLPDNPYDLIFKGSYPPLHDPEKHFIPEDWFEGYIDTYISRDVEELINPSNTQTFKKFIRICALHSGQMLSMDSIARDVGMTAPTIKSWLSILERSYIVHFLEPDSNNLGRALVKSPKLYFVDTGLLCHLLRIESKEELLLSEKKGAVVETFAVSELLKNRTNAGKKGNLTYFRDRTGFEVDTIADWKNSFAIEVKSTSESEAKASKNLRKYLELKGDKDTRGAVFYLGDLTMNLNGIDYVGWRDWGQIKNE